MECLESELDSITYIAPIEIFKVPSGAGWVLKVDAAHKTRFFTPLYEANECPPEDFPYQAFFEQMMEATEGELRLLCGNLFNISFSRQWNVHYQPHTTTKESYLIADCTLIVDNCLATDWQSDYMVKIAKRIRGWEYRLQLSYYSGIHPGESEE